MKKVLLMVTLIGLSLCLYLYFFRDNGKQSFLDRYGKSLNNDRSKKYLPIIEDSWTLRRYDSSYVVWDHPSNLISSGTPEHIWKRTKFQDSTIVSEEDVFNYNLSDSLGYRLIVTSSFQKLDSVEFKFIKHYFRNYPPSETINVNYQF